MHMTSTIALYSVLDRLMSRENISPSPPIDRVNQSTRRAMFSFSWAGGS